MSAITVTLSPSLSSSVVMDLCHSVRRWCALSRQIVETCAPFMMATTSSFVEIPGLGRLSSSSGSSPSFSSASLPDIAE